MSHLIHCDLLLYGRKFSHSGSRLPGDVMGKVLTVAKTNGADPPPPPPGTESGFLLRLNLPPPS